MLRKTNKQLSISSSNTAQGQKCFVLLRLESVSTAAQLISFVLLLLSIKHCVPQSSAVIKQLKGSVNWDDRIENDRSLYVSLRDGEYFGVVSGKRRRGRSADKGRCALMVCECIVFAFSDSRVHLSHTSLHLVNEAPRPSGEIPCTASLSRRNTKCLSLFYQ